VALLIEMQAKGYCTAGFGLGTRASMHNNGICLCCWWWFGLVGNVVGRINEVNQRQARLVLGWVTIFKNG